MPVVPHVTHHKDGSSSAKLNVRAAGLSVEDTGLERVAELLIGFAESEEVQVSRYALWFTDRTEKTNLTVEDASKRLKAAVKRGDKFSIEEEFGTTRDGRSYPNRYAGRIKIENAAKPAKAAPSAAAAAFLKG